MIQFGNDVTWYIPLGLREWFVKRGVENVIELDWWQEIHHKGRPDILIACVPSMVSNYTQKKKKTSCLIIFSTKVVQPHLIKMNLYGVASF